MGLRFEVWSAPGVGTYTKRIADLPVISATWQDYRKQQGSATLTLPRDYARLSEVLHTDVQNTANQLASVVKVFQDDTFICDILPEGTPDELSETEILIRCKAIEALVGRAVVEPWDWDGTAEFTSQVPDWIFSGRNTLPDLGLGDLQSIREEWQVFNTGTGGTFTLTVEWPSGVTDTTTAFDWDESAVTIEGSSLTGVGLQGLSNVVDVTVAGTGKPLTYTLTNNGSGGTFTLTVELEDGSTDTTGAIAYNANAATVETAIEGLSTVTNVQVTGVAQNLLVKFIDPVSPQFSATSSVTGGTLSLTRTEAFDPWVITFYNPPAPTTMTVNDSVTGGASFLDLLVPGEPSPLPITISQFADARIDPRIHGDYADPALRVLTTAALLDTDADWTLEVNALGRFAGSQLIVGGLQPGQLYQASIRVRPTVTGDYTLVIRDVDNNLIADVRDVPLTAGVYTTLSIEDVTIPQGVTEVIFRVAVTDSDPSNIADFYVNWQGALFIEGRLRNAGEIGLELYADATTDHAGRTTLSMLNPTWTALVDSSNTPWPGDLPVDIQRGQKVDRVYDVIFGRLGYEWNVVPSSTPGVWDWNFWAPGNRVDDVTGDASPSIVYGQNQLQGVSARRLPEGNTVTVEGAGNASYRSEDSDSVGAIGRRETYLGDVSYLGDLDVWADEQLDRYVAETYAPQVVIADSAAGPKPALDYGLATLLNVTVRGLKVPRTVETIGFRLSDRGLEWNAQTGVTTFDTTATAGAGGGGNAGLAAMAPVAEGVRRLLTRVNRLESQARPQATFGKRGGGELTVTVANYDSSQTAIDKADFFAEQGNGARAIQDAIDSINGPGRVVLAEGNYDIVVPSSGAAITLPNYVDLVGASWGAYLLAFNNDSGYMIEANDFCRISDLSIDAFGNCQGITTPAFTTQVIVERCYIETDAGIGIRFGDRNSEFTVDRCFITASSFAAPNIEVENGYRFQITNNRIASGNHNIRIYDNGTSPILPSNILIDGNWLWSAGDESVDIQVGRGFPSFTRIVNNFIQASGTNNPGVGAVNVQCSTTPADLSDQLDVEPGLLISGNQIEDSDGQPGIRLSYAHGAIVTGNHIENTQGHGILLENTSQADISDNLILWPLTDLNTYDAIHVDGGFECKITGNRPVNDTVGTLATWRYGINIAAGTCHIVVGNVFGDPADYGTDALNDAGTSTRLEWPSDPVYGSNFTDCGASSS